MGKFHRYQKYLLKFSILCVHICIIAVIFPILALGFHTCSLEYTKKYKNFEVQSQRRKKYFPMEFAYMVTFSEETDNYCEHALTQCSKGFNSRSWDTVSGGPLLQSRVHPLPPVINYHYFAVYDSVFIIIKYVVRVNMNYSSRSSENIYKRKILKIIEVKKKT